MDLLDCYRLLGLRSGASFLDIKSSYRRLAQQYHPDINPDDERAKEKFIALTEAYKLLLQVIPPPSDNSHKNVSQAVETPQKHPTRATETWQQNTHSVPKQPPPQKPKSKFLRAQLGLARMYMRQIEALGYDVYHARMAVPPALKELRLLFS